MIIPQHLRSARALGSTRGAVRSDQRGGINLKMPGGIGMDVSSGERGMDVLIGAKKDAACFIGRNACSGGEDSGAGGLGDREQHLITQ